MYNKKITYKIILLFCVPGSFKAHNPFSFKYEKLL